jgi:aminoglycoside phosphotransferase (APT) family kinase protein
MMPDVGVARALLREIGIVVSDEQVIPTSGGTVNASFRILQGREPSLFLRIAPSDAEVEAGPGWMSAHGLRRELTAIQMLEPLLGILPRTVHTDWSRTLIERDWVLQTEVRGTPWSDLRDELTLEQDRDLWRQLGELARTLHSLRSQQFGPPEEGFGHESWSDMIRWDVTGLQVDARRFGIDPEPFLRLTSLVNASVPILDEVTEPCLIHSDLYPHHVFVRRDDDGAMTISGLIDFEFARFADPLSESVFVGESLDPTAGEGFDAFCEAYGVESSSANSRVREHIYALIALGWIATDLHRTGQTNRIPEVLDRMNTILSTEEGLF